MDIDVLAIAAVAITVVLFVLLSYLGRKKNVDFGILTILALVFGIVIGIIFKGHVELTAVFGRIYTNLISALVIPLLFVSIISSISSLDNISKLKTIGLKSIFWLVANTFTASLLTLIIAGSLKVGQSIILHCLQIMSQKRFLPFSIRSWDCFRKMLFHMQQTARSFHLSSLRSWQELRLFTYRNGRKRRQCHSKISLIQQIS